MSGPASRRIAPRRVAALIGKESLQVVRDPSAILIAFVLPVVLMLLFSYAVSLDIRSMSVGVVREADDAPSQSLAAAFAASRYFAVTPARDRREVEDKVVAGKLRGFIVIPQDFAHRLTAGRAPLVQIVTDGSQPNTAKFVANDAQGVLRAWLLDRNQAAPQPIALVERFLFNPELESRRALLPGSIAIIMTMIGTLLTALVVAREWERGTMEAILSTPATIAEILIGKLAPYFVLGMAATVGCALFAVHFFEVPLRGSWGALLFLSAVFLVPALGQGLLISTLARNQFVASQLALLTGFLPSYLLSGFLFEIDAMPTAVHALTYVVPARYFVPSLQTVFLAGDVWPLLLPNAAAMLAIGGLFFAISVMKTKKSLDR
tara:strand:- start:354 stop:1484 length:1131 start_codon:yes stop_codon:yes gene_type:complete